MIKNDQKSTARYFYPCDNMEGNLTTLGLVLVLLFLFSAILVFLQVVYLLIYRGCSHHARIPATNSASTGVAPETTSKELIPYLAACNTNHMSTQLITQTHMQTMITVCTPLKKNWRRQIERASTLFYTPDSSPSAHVSVGRESIGSDTANRSSQCS
jgi:hypothetical protein